MLCLGVPPEVLGNYNYSNFITEFVKPEPHIDFVNETGTMKIMI